MRYVRNDPPCHRPKQASNQRWQSGFVRPGTRKQSRRAWSTVPFSHSLRSPALRRMTDRLRCEAVTWHNGTNTRSRSKGVLPWAMSDVRFAKIAGVPRMGGQHQKHRVRRSAIYGILVRKSRHTHAGLNIFFVMKTIHADVLKKLCFTAASFSARYRGF